MMKLFDVYPLFDIEPVRAFGSFLWDKSNQRYLDAYGGHGVISIGHGHLQYVSRLSAQLSRIGFYSNSVQNPLQEELALNITKFYGYPDYALFLCNSGAEANENALKLASFHTGKKKIIAFKGSFHGRTSLAVAVTDDAKISAPVNASEDVIFLPLNDEEKLEAAFSEEVCAVIIEGIQGVAGVQEPVPAFLQNIRTLCDRFGSAMILDEVQSGYGRTGNFFAHQQAGVTPDLITMAKGMGNGFPVAGVLIHPAIQARHGMLGTTFGGNYLACTAALAVLEVMQQESLMQNAAELGEYLVQGLKMLPGVKEVRGRGLMIGIALDVPAAAIRKQLLEQEKVLTGGATDPYTIRLLPSLGISKEEADLLLQAFKNVLTKNTTSCNTSSMQTV